MPIVPLALALGFPAHPMAAGPPWTAEAVSALIGLVFTVWLARFASRRSRMGSFSPAARVLPFIPKHALHDPTSHAHRLRGA